MPSDPKVALSTPVSDEVRKTTCYMCACRCGIDVHIKDGKIRYIEGNRDHPVNRGVLCAKGSAGIMQHYAPARLSAPLKRVGPRGSGEFQEISWDEALAIATGWLDGVRQSDPRKLAFFTGRDQSQSLTGFWAQQFGTPNYAAHGGFCSVNMAAAGIMTIGGAFWEFGAPDWDRTKLFVLFGVAEDHDSNPLKIGISKLKKRGARFVSVNPVRTGYSAVADNWIGIRPGTDGLLILAVVHELLKARRIDVDYLAALFQRALAGRRCAWRRRPRPVRARRRRQAAGLRNGHRTRRAGRRRRARGQRFPAATSSPTAVSRSRRSSFSPNDISTRNTRRRRSPPRPALPPRRSAGLPPRSRASPSTRRSASSSPGPT